VHDACEAQGEGFGLPRGPCHAACDDDCVATYGQITCLEWQAGQGDFDEWLLYADPPVRTGPFPGPCP
jgi:hypothetical protein